MSALLTTASFLMFSCVEKAASETKTVADETLLGADVTHYRQKGKISRFGGPSDLGMKKDEGLALINNVGQAPELFLPVQPPGTTGLARRLNPWKFFVALRWDYKKTPKDVLKQSRALVVNPDTGGFAWARPVDWGPHKRTGRMADLSDGLADYLGVDTDDTVVIHLFVPKALD